MVSIWTVHYKDLSLVYGWSVYGLNISWIGQYMDWLVIVYWSLTANQWSIYGLEVPGGEWGGGGREGECRMELTNLTIHYQNKTDAPPPSMDTD